MDYVTIIGVAILVSIIIGFYIFYCRLNDSNSKVKQLERDIKFMDENQEKINKKINQPWKGVGDHQNEVNNVTNTNNNQKPALQANNGNQAIANQGSNSNHQNNTNYQNNIQSQKSHGSIVAEKRNPVSICANSEPSEESNNCTNYGPIPDEIDNVQLHTIENMSEYPVDLLA